MAKGTVRRITLGGCALALLATSLIAMTMSTTQTEALTVDGTVALAPAIVGPPTTGPLTAGDRFQIYVVVDDLQHIGALPYDDNRDTVPDRQVESLGLGAFEFTLVYNPAVVAVDRVERGPASLDETGRSFSCLRSLEEVDSVRFGCTSLGSGAGPQGTLTLARVTFEALAPGFSALELDANLSGPLGDHVPIEVHSGVAHVVTEKGTLPADPAPAEPEVDDQVQPTIAAPVATTSFATTSSTPVGVSATVKDRTPAGDAEPSPAVRAEAEGPGSDGEPQTVDASEGGDGSDDRTRWLVMGLGGFAAVAVAAATAVMRRRFHGGV